MEKTKKKNVLFRVVGTIFKYYTPHCILVLACIIGAALCQVQGALFLQKLIDNYIIPLTGTQNPDFGPLGTALFQMALIYGIGALCAYLMNRIMVNVSQGTLRNLRFKMFERMERLPVRYFDTHAHGDIMSMYTNDTDTLRQLISQSLPQICSSLITVVSVFVSMIVLSLPLTGLAVVMMIVSIFATRFMAGKSGKYFGAQQKDLGAVNGYIEEMMEGQKVVKVFCHEEENLEGFRKLNNQLKSSGDKANTYANILMPVNGQLGNLSYVLCAVLGALLALSGFGSLSLGALVSFLTLNRNFTQPIAQISQQLGSVTMAMAGAARVFDLLDQEPEPDDGYVSLVNAKENAAGDLEECQQRTGIWAWKHPHSDGSISYTRLSGDVVMDKVDFGYTEERMVLHEVELFATPGQKIAFVGSTGAGKTTITNLINRFYDIQDGKIRYDGININKIKKADLRRSLGIVLQDTNLFTGTVLENIRYGRLDATDEECIAAAKLVSAHSFIQHLEQGYNTVLSGNGGNLSQGQRQLLAIARAAVADPPVLILDEATSSIDTRTERLVQQGMDGLMKGRTSFVIAHRLSTVRNADCIMVLEAGRVVERGSHSQLIQLKGRYYQLYTGMSGSPAA